jgi:toxin ParE1/3/4
MKATILEQAYKELEDAVDYYEGEQDGLGLRMMEEVDHHVEWILRNPTVSQLREGGYRRVNLKTFSYFIAYMIHEERLWVLAIANGYRKPEYWIKRKNEIS